MSIIAGTAIESAAGGGYEIERSLRFNSADTTNLQWTPSVSPTSRTKTTLSFWVKRSAISSGTYQNIYSVAVSSGYYSNSGFETTDQFTFGINTSNYLYTTQLFRDPSAWYHFVCVVDTTQATASDRLKVYVNGSRITSFSSSNYPSLNSTDNYLLYTYNQIIGGVKTSGTGGSVVQVFNGYMAEFYGIDGQALDPTSFGEFNSTTGVWQPIAYEGSYGTNGFYLPFNQEYETFTADYLVGAGGGGGGGGANGAGGGGGAGGYRTSAGTSGGGASAESSLILFKATAYTVTVGAGGNGGTLSTYGYQGSNSVFNTITSTGGGRGGYDTGQPSGSGGSGGGSSARSEGGGSGTANQGYAGGGGYDSTLNWTAGGGGGAGGVGGTGGSGLSGAGGAGVSSSITGSAVTRASGGSGGAWNTGQASGATAGGGGAGGAGRNVAGTNATGNTGGGGGGGGQDGAGGNGGSGLVIIKVPDTVTATFSGGVTSSSSTSGGYTVYTITATSTTSETVTFS